MTTIASYRNDRTGEIAIAADSAVTGEFLFTLRSGKLYQCGDLVVGLAGVLPPRPPTGDYKATYDGLTRLADEIKSAHDDIGNGGTTEDGVRVLPVAGVAIGKTADGTPFGPFVLSSTGHFYEPDQPYAVAGSGGALALGAIVHAIALRDLNPRASWAKEGFTRTLVTGAIAVAATHDPHTRGPVHFLML